MTLDLLLVEDDADYAAALAAELRDIGHRVDVAADGWAAIAAMNAGAFDAVILDRMMPRLDGMSVLQKLRDGGMTLPIVMLTALGASQDKVEGLEAGADDYVVKPVAAIELHARLHAVLRGRQWSGGAGASGDTLRAGDIVVSPATFRAWRDGVPLDLAKLELKLLVELVRNVDAVLTRAMLIERVWGYDFMPDTNIVDVHIRRLRLKLGEGGGEDRIRTVRGIGYMLQG